MAEHRLVIGLNAVVAALSGDDPCVLCVQRRVGWGLPFGPFTPSQHRTFEIGLRDFVQKQTNIPLGYVEQLYTFGDMGREAPLARLKDSDPSDRIVSVGYLALSPTTHIEGSERTAWHSWYHYFPWEDWREGPPAALEQLLPALLAWADTDDQVERICVNFGTEGFAWEEERVLDRYELLYEAGLLQEVLRDRDEPLSPADGTGHPMLSDHRRILATAIGRLRGKLRYRPIIFKMVPDLFTLTHLQNAVESILGFSVHKQNFRRSLETAALVEKTEGRAEATGGRPAALYRASPYAKEKHGIGLTLPRLR